ncbi:MAG: hypothetical protein INR69_19420 [Mucilaginibacter polytrichastri]|nr:hypothetical protein [Mucilaginibacter polytrichastri]
METIIAHPDNTEKLDALKAFMKAQDIDFDVQSTYPSEIISGVKKAMAEAEAGQTAPYTSLKDLL